MLLSPWPSEAAHQLSNDGRTVSTRSCVSKSVITRVLLTLPYSVRTFFSSGIIVQRKRGSSTLIRPAMYVLWDVLTAFFRNSIFIYHTYVIHYQYETHYNGKTKCHRFGKRYCPVNFDRERQEKLTPYSPPTPAVLSTHQLASLETPGRLGDFARRTCYPTGGTTGHHRRSGLLPTTSRGATSCSDVDTTSSVHHSRPTSLGRDGKPCHTNGDGE